MQLLKLSMPSLMGGMFAGAPSSAPAPDPMQAPTQAVLASKIRGLMAAHKS